NGRHKVLLGFVRWKKEKGYTGKHSIAPYVPARRHNAADAARRDPAPRIATPRHNTPTAPPLSPRGAATDRRVSALLRAERVSGGLSFRLGSIAPRAVRAGDSLSPARRPRPNPNKARSSPPAPRARP